MIKKENGWSKEGQGINDLIRDAKDAIKDAEIKVDAAKAHLARLESLKISHETNIG